MVPSPIIFAKDPFMRLKRKKLGLTTDLKEGRREEAMARAMAGEEDSLHMREKRQLLSEEVDHTKLLLVCSKESKGTLREIFINIVLSILPGILNMCVKYDLLS